MQRAQTDLIVGKQGLTENTIKQAIALLKKSKIIKVKFLPTAIQDNKKELAKQLAVRTKTKIAHRVGFTVILEKIK
ncbi:YhbY family RNA-binding protein [Candidatus Woesearchaeota archaeon]|nr:YhbY family RNA-binding protein [Candidatus Woesearchaeota archaeon]